MPRWRKATGVGEKMLLPRSTKEAVAEKAKCGPSGGAKTTNGRLTIIEIARKATKMGVKDRF